MVDFLYSLDQAIFYFVNHTLGTPLLDVTMPWLTDINQHWVGRGLLIGLWLLLLVRAGKEGRIAALLLIPTIVFSDQLSSSVLKFMFDRPRPCHTLVDVRLLVPCGSGYSFPSSHAVNGFAAATVLSHYFGRWWWGFFGFAFLLALSRVYVGVHYPSDVIGGATIGLLCGWGVVRAYEYAVRLWQRYRGIDSENSESRQ